MCFCHKTITARPHSIIFRSQLWSIHGKRALIKTTEREQQQYTTRCTYVPQSPAQSARLAKFYKIWAITPHTTSTTLYPAYKTSQSVKRPQLIKQYRFVININNNY